MKDVRTDCTSFSGLISEENPAQSVKGIKSGKTRITLIALDGTVLADTDANEETMENHLYRDEIADAISNGKGEALRYSDTIKKESYYYALLLESGYVLRTARPLDSITQVFGRTIPIVILIIFFIIIISVFIATKLTDKIMKPVNIAAAQLDGVLSEEYIEFEDLTEYDEFLPFVRKIRYLNREIRSYVKQLKQQSNTLNTITRNMREGLILLDGEMHILSVNAGARRMLRISEDSDYSNKTLITLSRNTDIIERVEEVISTKSSCYMDVESDGEYQKYFFSPVLKDGGSILGVIIFIVNATVEMKNAKIRRDFASNVSHELKTPLTSINGFAEMLENSMIREKADVIKTAKLIHKESSRMITLVDDIMRLSQIESGTLSEAENISLLDTANEVVSALSASAGNKKVKLEAELAPVFVKANPSMVYELMFNLCDNAIKYNKPGGEVRLSVSLQDNNVIISVSDTGIGIPDEHLDRIFERFYRVDKSRSKQTGGTGLGLSIVKHIVEVMNGTIKIQSEKDKGTTITVSIHV
jgi:two-component system phosphate regulon sensor histidine kinase PhoR